jgi:AraC family transcriptional regulator
MDTGYENPSSFNKAFRKRFGVAPNEFRDNKRVPWVVQTNLKAIFMDNTALKPKIKEIKEKKVIYVQSIGDYNKTAKPAWEKVCGFAQKHKLFGFSTEMIGISYDDPSITEPDRCRYEACVAVSKEVKPEGEVGFKTIPAGKYAVFNFKGPYEKLHEAYDYIFGKYIPENKIELRNAPCFEKYLNSPDKTKPENLKTEICIPIE